MQQNRNNFFNDVASLKTIPAGEVFDAESVWNKLESKINNKKKRKALWIWFAASMLVLICVSVFFKTNHSTNKNIVIAKTNQLKRAVVDNPNEIKKANNTIIQSIKNDKKKVLLNAATFVNDTASIAIEIPRKTVVDSAIKPNEEKKIVAMQQPIRKRLKIVYASDFADENDVAKMKQQEKIAVTKGLFKVFETPANKEVEENSLLEHNKLQPNKTLMFFKTKPEVIISFNQNQ